MGRPPMPAAEKCGERVTIRMTKAERRTLEREAKRLGVSLAALLLRPWRKEEGS